MLCSDNFGQFQTKGTFTEGGRSGHLYTFSSHHLVLRPCYSPNSTQVEYVNDIEQLVVCELLVASDLCILSNVREVFL